MSYRNHIGRRRRFQRPIVALPVPLMHLWIIQQRRWWLLPGRNSTQKFGISHRDSSHATGRVTLEAGGGDKYLLT